MLLRWTYIYTLFPHILYEISKADDFFLLSDSSILRNFDYWLQKYRGGRRRRRGGGATDTNEWPVPLILVNNQLDALFSMYLFTSLLFTFWATQCSSSGESIVSIHHLVYVTLCRWLPGMPVRKDCHTRQSPTQSDIYQMMYCYNWFSWWWALGCSKREQKRSK